MKKRAYISYFLLAIFALIYSHQLIPHHEHQHDVKEKLTNSSCSHHQEVVCHTEETASFSHLLDHLFDGDFHFEFSCTDIFYKNLQSDKNFKVLHCSIIEYTQQQNVFQAKSINYQSSSTFDNFHLEAFSLRGPPKLV